MAKTKRPAEAAPEQSPAQKFGKKRRVSDGAEVKTKGAEASAPLPSPAPATPADGPAPSKKKKKVVKDELAPVPAAEEPGSKATKQTRGEATAATPSSAPKTARSKKSSSSREDAMSLTPVASTSSAAARPSSTKKDKHQALKEADSDGAPNTEQAPSPADHQDMPESERRRLKKEAKRRKKERKAAAKLAEATEASSQGGASDSTSRARLQGLQKQHDKAKKNAAKIDVVTKDGTGKQSESGIDIDALRREIREEILQELKEKSSATKRSRSTRVNGQQKPKGTSDETSNSKRVRPSGLNDEDVKMKNDASEEGDQSKTRGFVFPFIVSKGLKLTSNRSQLVQLDYSLASIDTSGFSQQVQNKLQYLRSLEWQISAPTSGRILNIDPTYSLDGGSIFIAYTSCIKVFSTKTSLVLRVLEVTGAQITDMALSADGNVLQIATGQGQIDSWNWSTGEKIESHRTFPPVVAFGVVAGSSQQESDRTYAVTSKDVGNLVEGGSGQRIHVSSLGNTPPSKPKAIFQTQAKIRKPTLLDNGRIIVTAAGKRLIVGILQSAQKASVGSLEYLWHELDCPSDIHCIDVYPTVGPRPDAHVAIGTNGPIFLYRNLVSQIQAIHKKKVAQPVVQRLHWHRYPVRTVKFSRDGNYLISGGFETVLCKWQLDTGAREDLPHLTAPINALVISPNGASYAIALDNNSLIILSTLDYRPYFAIAGPTQPRFSGLPSARPNSNTFPAVMMPGSLPTQLVLASPALESTGASTSAVYLQTVDARTGSQSEKQALTRTNVTDRVSDSQGRILRDPNVTHLAILSDGKWLATVDEWVPPPSDFEHLASGHDCISVAKSRRETYLKFWSRNEDDKTWQLSSRIDFPHSDGPLRELRVFDLITDKDRFLTIGGDGQIKVWEQEARQRGGIPLKTQPLTPLTSWHCSRVITPHSPPIVNNLADKLVSARLALAADATLLIAIFKYRQSTVVRLINHANGTVLLSRADLPVDDLIGAAIVDQYLVILSEHLIVWDLVHDRLQYSYCLRSADPQQRSQHAFTHLAAHSAGTFAIAIPTKGQASELIIFDPSSPDPLAVRDLPNLIRALIPADGSQGFVLIDTDSQVRQVQAPKSTVESILASQQRGSEIEKAEGPALSLPLSNIFADTGAGEIANAASTPAVPSALSRSHLFTSASLGELFEQVDYNAPGATKLLFEEFVNRAIGRANA